MAESEPWDAIIVAGGAGRRLGGISKSQLMLGGMVLLDRTLAAIADARSAVVVGGPRRDGIAWTVEDPPGAGPAMAIAAGLRFLHGACAPWTVVLGVDTPRAADAVPAVLAVRAGDGAWLVDGDGREQPLIAAYRTASLYARAIATQPGDSLRSLTDGLAMRGIDDTHGSSRDVDTWEDVTYWEGVLR